MLTPAQWKARVKRQALESQGNGIGPKDWADMKRYVKHCCMYCGCRPRKLVKDHFIPLSKGGDHEVWNIVPSCRTCNLKKGANYRSDPRRPNWPWHKKAYLRRMIRGQ